MEFEELLDLLVCPKCKGGLERQLDGENGWLICRKCGLKFPVKDGIPDMLLEDAGKI